MRKEIKSSMKKLAQRGESRMNKLVGMILKPTENLGTLVARNGEYAVKAIDRK